MLATVLKDKEKIENTIEELDRYKRDALQKTWEKVDGCVPCFIARCAILAPMSKGDVDV